MVTKRLYIAMHRFHDIKTLNVQVTACDLEKSFSFNKTIEITGHMRSPIQCKHIALTTCYIFRGMYELESFHKQQK